MFAVINVLSSTGILWKKNGSHASTISLCYTRSTTNQQWVSIIHWMVLICKQKKKRKLTHNDCCLLFLESQVNKNGCRVVVRQAPLVNDSTINRMVVLKPKHMHRFSCLLQRKVSFICVCYIYWTLNKHCFDSQRLLNCRWVRVMWPLPSLQQWLVWEEARMLYNGETTLI